MSWSLYINDPVDKDEAVKALQAAADQHVSNLPADWQEGTMSQIDAAKSAVEALVSELKGDKVRVSASGHFGTKDTAPGMIAVSVSEVVES